MKFKPMKERMRASFSADAANEPRLGGVDREHETLHDVQITLEGEALGHDVWLDRAFCEAVVEQGNACGEAGLKVRFGHPSMCSDALGTYLGRARNFRCVNVTRKDGTSCSGVIADIEIAPEAHKAPSGDLAAWVLDTAENSPDTFGQSIVFTYADMKVKDETGAEFMQSAYESEDEWLGHSADGKVFAVLGKLHGTDFTDTPAATDGVFSADSLAAQAHDLLEENPRILAALLEHPDNVVQFLKREGFWDVVESKRLAGLQAEKDREIADIRKVCDALTAENEQQLAAAIEIEKAHQAALAAKDEEILKMKNDFEDALRERGAALDAEKDRAEQLAANLAETEKALGESAEQLARWKESAALRAGSVNNPPEAPVSYESVVSSASATPAEKLAAAQAEAKLRRTK